MTSPAPVLYRVHLVDEATVVSRGERVRVWYVRQGDAWVKAAEVASAQVETDSSERQDESCPPGTIWQRNVELLLPGDTRLLCRTTKPLTERLEPMDYLRRGKLGMNRHTHESTHRVVGNYRFERVDE